MNLVPNTLKMMGITLTRIAKQSLQEVNLFIIHQLWKIKLMKSLRQDVTEYPEYVLRKHTLFYWESSRGPRKRKHDRELRWLGEIMMEH